MQKTFWGIALNLWGETPQDALHRAIQAQSQPIWRALWLQCIESVEASKPPVKEGAERDNGASGAVRSVRAMDAAVIVAGFVLSVPRSEEIEGITENTGANSCTGAITSTRKTAPAAVRSAVSPSNVRRYVCVSLGSGSRCLGVRDPRSNSAETALQRALELRDGHAEVMARRGLIAFLIDLAEAGGHLSATDGNFPVPFLQRVGETSNESEMRGWALKQNVRVHLVCSRWMCGSLAGVAGGTGRSGHLLIAAGCGCWASTILQQQTEETENNAIGNGKRAFSPSAFLRVEGHVIAAHYSPLDDAIHYAKCARVKPGRGRPNLTMSCTDKVWRWAVLGLQGRRRAALFPVAMRLSSVHVLQPAIVASAAATTFSGPSPGLKDDQQESDVVVKARELFRWRTQSWWPNLSAADLAIVTPAFALFEAPTSTQASAAAAAASSPELNAESERGDSSYSRCRWLTVRHSLATFPPSTRKRERSKEKRVETHDDYSIDENGAESSLLCCDWRTDNNSSRVGCTNSLVLNTKAGLPQGMTACGLAQLAQRRGAGDRLMRSDQTNVLAENHPRIMGDDVTDRVWRQCPLSRPWMSHRVACAIAASKTAALPTLNRALSSFSSCCPTHEWYIASEKPSVVSLLTNSVLPLPMREVAHWQHVHRTNEKCDGAVFLWTVRESNRVGAPTEGVTEATDNT